MRAMAIFSVLSTDSRLLILPFIPLTLMVAMVISLFFLILFLLFFPGCVVVSFGVVGPFLGLLSVSFMVGFRVMFASGTICGADSWGGSFRAGSWFGSGGFCCFSVSCAGAGCLILIRPLCSSASNACGVGWVGCLLAGGVGCLLAGGIGCLMAGWLGCLLAGWLGCLLAGRVGCLLAGGIGCLLAGWVGCLLAGWVGCLLAGWVGCLLAGWVGCLLAGWEGCLLVGWVGCLLAGWVGFTSYRWVVVRGFRKVTFFFGRQFIEFYLWAVLERMVSMALANSLSWSRSW